MFSLSDAVYRTLTDIVVAVSPVLNFKTFIMFVPNKKFINEKSKKITLRYVYTLRLIGPISYLGGYYKRTKVTKCIRQKMTLYFRALI